MSITSNDFQQAKEYSDNLKLEGTSSEIRQHGTKYIVTIGADLTCPFCEETDFDEAGLKHHLQNYCRKYAETENI